MPLRSTIRRTTRPLFSPGALLRPGGPSVPLAPLTANQAREQATRLRDHADTAIQTLAERPLPPDFDTVLLNQFRLRLLEILLHPDATTHQISQLMNLWLKHHEFQSKLDAHKPCKPVSPDRKPGLTPEAIEELERFLRPY